MSELFDIYHEWLGLSEVKGRPDYYVLLGLRPYEQDADRIHHAADQAMAKVRSFRPGGRAQQWAALLDELEQAKACLLDADQRHAYDEQLRYEEISPSAPEADLDSDPSPQTGSGGIHPLYPPGMGGNPVDIPQTATTPLPSPIPLSSSIENPVHPQEPEPAVTDSSPLASPVPSGWGAWAGASPQPEEAASSPEDVALTDPSTWTAQPVQQAVGGPVPMASPVVGPPLPDTVDADNVVPQALPVGSATAEILNTPPTGIAGGANPMEPLAGAPVPVGSVLSTPNAPYPVGSAVPSGEAIVGYQTSPVAAMPNYDRGVNPTVATIKSSRRRSSSMSQGAVIGLSIAAVVLVTTIIVVAVNLGGNDSSNTPVALAGDDTPKPPVPAIPDPVPAVPNPDPVPDPDPVPAVPNPDPIPDPDPVPETDPDPVQDPEPSDPPTQAELIALGEILTIVREALAYRELPLAEAELSRARALASKPELRERVARWTRIHALIAQFWIAVDESRQLLQVDQQLQVGSSTIVTVVENSSELLVISTEFGQKKRYASNFEISSGVAMALAEMSLEPGAALTQLVLGAFVAVDPMAADAEEARRYWAEAERLGMESASLEQILDEDYDPTEVVSIPPPDPEFPPSPIPMDEEPLTPAELAQLSELLTTARLALRERELVAADESIEQARLLARSPEHKAMVRRLAILAHYVEEFWSVYRESLASIGDGQELEIGNRIIVLVEIRPNVLIIRSAGRNITYSDKSVPAGLAMAIANKWFDPAAASTRVIRGAFYAVDPEGGIERARQTWQEAQFMGADVENLLLVLDDTYDDLQADAP